MVNEKVKLDIKAVAASDKSGTVVDKLLLQVLSHKIMLVNLVTVAVYSILKPGDMDTQCKHN